MKTLHAVAVAAIVSLPGTAIAGNPDPDVVQSSVSIGAQITHPTKDVMRYSMIRRGVVDLRLSADGKRFVVEGKTPGTASILLFERNGHRIEWVITVPP